MSVTYYFRPRTIRGKLCVLHTGIIKSGHPHIFAVTHIGGDDIQRIYEAIRVNAYLFLGDPKDIYRDFSGILLGCNGCICFETNLKEDRRIAYQRALELLRKGENILIFPEGCWNIYPDRPVGHLYPGTVKMAQETGAEIIPVAIEQYGKDFVVDIGEGFFVAKEANLTEKNQKLRDALASLKWNVFETEPIQARSEVANITVEDFEKEIVARCDYPFSVEEVRVSQFRAPGESGI